MSSEKLHREKYETHICIERERDFNKKQSKYISADQPNVIEFFFLTQATHIDC